MNDSVLCDEPNLQKKPVMLSRILLADDHQEMLDEVRDLLQGDFDVVDAVQDGQQLVERALDLKPDLIISDISMPLMTGFEAAAKIRALGLSSKIIFLTVQSSSVYLKKARALGADGYVLKVYSNEQLPLAVKQVLSGNQFFSPELQASRK
ncbi:MAG TPA: response regulator transcription factor [Terriglobales bacterium]